MKKLFILSILFLSGVQEISAQKKEKQSCNCGFQSTLNVGVMEGQTGGDFILQTVNGFQYKGWFAGIGTGIDYYRYRSIPLFLDIRKNILKKNHTPFIYADAGINFPWKKDDEMYFWESSLSSGFYYDAGIGMNFSIRKNHGFSFSAGYSYKFVKETATWPMQCLMPPCPQFKQTRSYDLNRLSMKIGFRINSN